MSSVSGSDSSGSASRQDEMIRRNRDDYRQNESEMVRRHQRELKRLNEEHYAEVQRLNQDHENEIKKIKAAANNDITDRDMKYQQEIDDIRELNRRQLQGQALEAQRREDMIKDSQGKAETNQSALYQERLHQLAHEYDTNLKLRDKAYNESTARVREAEQSAVRENFDKLSHENEESTKTLASDRDNRIRTMQKSFDEYRRATDGDRREMELLDLDNNRRASDTLKRSIIEERQLSQDAQDNLRAEMKEGLSQNKLKYNQDLQKLYDEYENSRSTLNRSVRGRLASQLNRAEGEYADLKDAKTRDEKLLGQKHHREMENLASSYQKSVDDLTEQRDQILRDTNDRVQRAGAKVHDEMAKEAVATNRFYRAQEDDQNRIFKSAYGNLKAEADVRNAQTKDLADQRVKTAYADTADQLARAAEQQADNHETSQRTYHNQVSELRSDLEQDKISTVTNLQEKMQTLEAQHSERMAQVVAKYKKEIAALKDDLRREKKVSEENRRRSVEEMEHSQKALLDQAEAQKKDRIRQLTAQHSQELRDLNRRNDEKIDQALSEMRKT